MKEKESVNKVKKNGDYISDEKNTNESFFDITGQKFLINSLNDSEELFKTLSESAQDAIFVINYNGTVLYWNKAAEQRFGYTNAETLGCNFYKKLIPVRYYNKYRNEFVLFRKRGPEFVLGNTREFTGMKKDRTEFPVEVIFSSIKWKGEWIAIGIIRDISEKRKLESHIIQAQKMEAVGTLSAGIAHDFNNMLTGIMSTISLMKKKIADNYKFSNGELNKYLNIMYNSGSRAGTMVKQLQNLSRKNKIILAPVDLNNVIQQVTDLFTAAMDKSIEVVLHYSDNKAMVRGDENQLEQILFNLCINAGHSMTIMRKEGEPIGGRLTVAVQTVQIDNRLRSIYKEAEEGDYWRLSVKDTGIGMDDEILNHIFDPFFTIKEKGQGTGLGLTMVYYSLKQHKGFIDVHSEVGSGTTINVYLPVYDGKLDEENFQEDTMIHNGKGLILVVDDEESILKVAKSILEECGYEVILACDGEDGLNIFKSRNREISAVLMDMSMPKKCGKDAFIEMQKINPDISVILSSGSCFDERIDELIHMGIKDFIQKPYSFKRLADAMFDLGKSVKPQREDTKIT